MSYNFRGAAGSANNSPSTPSSKNGRGFFTSQAPSTTPVGPPPSYLTNKSTTPAGDPPRSSKVFGSSFNAANNTFGHRDTAGRRGRQTFVVPESSPPPEEEDEDDYDDDDAEGEMDEDYTQQSRRTFDDPTLDSPRGLKRSHNGDVLDHDPSGMQDIARAFARSNALAQLHESDDVVLQTEAIVAQTDQSVREHSLSENREETIATGIAQLTRAWSQAANPKTKAGKIGPDSQDAFTRANYIATLLLQLHDPHTSKSTFAPKSSRPTKSLILAKQAHASSIPLPRALLDWLDAYHKPFPDESDDILMYRPSPSAHESFWDVVGADLVRGKFRHVIRLFKDAGFEHAITAEDDGSSGQGYEGKQLENVEEVISRCISVIESCPAVTHDDWDIKGGQWAHFRQRVRLAVSDLEAFAKGNSRESQPAQTNVFAQSNLSMSEASMRAGSRVPWTIYENLKTVYGVLQGGDEIVDFAQDWLESAILLTAWWDGEGSNVPSATLAGSTSLRASTRGATREIDISPLTAYRRRLSSVFRTVTTQIEEFAIDSLDDIQVALACVMEDNVGAVIGMLRVWSQTIATSVVEAAALSGWLPQARPSSRGLLQRGFSTEDLMVLSHGPGDRSAEPDEVDRDAVLIEYAELVADRDVLRSKDGQVVREGWEVAVSVLDRLDSRETSQTKVAETFGAMQFHDEIRVDKVLEMCAATGLVEQARGIAERYADTLTESLHSHGAALIYYARAHATQKLKSTISDLISVCLLHSAAFPLEANMDARLASLLSKQRTALLSLARADPEAATLLSGQLSGYATVRKFYELRDQHSSSKSLERKREAANALIAVIESASDCIRGGLFDPDVVSVVPSDGLLALLGETLPLLGQEKRIFAKQQVYSLLRIVEDLDTGPGRIKQNAEGLLQAAMNAYRNGTPSGSTLLKKSRSNLSASGSGSGLGGSSWDLLAASAMSVSQERGKESKIQRSWDWRKGLDAVAGADIRSQEVIMLLRTALAREVARGWSGEIGW